MVLSTQFRQKSNTALVAFPGPERGSGASEGSAAEAGQVGR